MVLLKHDLVPAHRILSQEEKEKLFEKYNISKFQLPLINIKDLGLSNLSPKIDDLIEIKRKGILGSYIYYRRVVE